MNAIKYIQILLALTLLASCSENSIDEPVIQDEESANWHTYSINVETSSTTYDNITRASIDYQWPDQSVIFIYVSSLNYGIATYSATDNSWALNFNGASSLTEKECKLYYLEGLTLEIDFSDEEKADSILSNVTVAPSYIAYSGTGKLSIDGEASLLRGSFSPHCKRVRFVGNPEETISIKGATPIKSFSLSGNEFSTGSNNETLTTSVSSLIGEQNSTEYIYLLEEDINDLKIKSGDYVYMLDENSNAFKTGMSGWLNIPTPEAHDGWLMEAYQNISCSSTATTYYYNSGDIRNLSSTITSAFPILVSFNYSVSYNWYNSLTSNLSLHYHRDQVYQSHIVLWNGESYSTFSNYRNKMFNFGEKKATPSVYSFYFLANYVTFYAKNITLSNF